MHVIITASDSIYQQKQYKTILGIKFRILNSTSPEEEKPALGALNGTPAPFKTIFLPGLKRTDNDGDKSREEKFHDGHEHHEQYHSPSSSYHHHHRQHPQYHHYRHHFKYHYDDHAHRRHLLAARHTSDRKSERHNAEGVTTSSRDGQNPLQHICVAAC